MAASFSLRTDENKALRGIFSFVTCTSPARMGGVRNHCFRIDQSEHAQFNPSINIISSRRRPRETS
jgi:hypothetical protein